MAKTQIKNYVFKPGIGASDNRFPNAYSLLSANKEFIQKEATAWIQDQVDASAAGFVGYTYNQAKCERDVGYVVGAYLKDLRYGGNENVRKTIKYYWDQGVAQVDGDRQPEIQTHTWIGNLIKDNILTQVAYDASNTEVSQTLSGSASETTTQFTPTDATYKPATGVMTLTIGTHSLVAGDEIHISPGGITFTCALDGGATLHPYPRASGVPNNTGKDPYYYAPITITSTTSTTITTNVGISSDTSVHTFSSAITNSITSGPTAKINTLVFNTVDVITNGLTGLPKFIATGVATVKVQGRFDLEDFLLITNTTKNEIIYNFSSIETGGSVEFKSDNISEDESFPKYLQTVDAITTLTLNYNASLHSSTDEIQIFIEKTENGKSVTTVRPYDFGTDSIERMRIAPPLSMLDADFEYGLQPTKWAAIGTLRGYPSVYEIPGTDTPVLSVVTDASAGTEGIGQSLITVTTVGPHGFEAGTPITIKALEDSVSGGARAEGSFVINDVPGNTSFTYFAKAKVGTANPTTLSTTYTQLRQAAFYTGANIGASPEIAVVSNGFNGELFAQLDIPSGETRIPFDGPSPGLGAPLNEQLNSRIPLGAQVTSVIDQSAGGGTFLTPLVSGDYPAGTTEIELVDATGVLEDLAADSGDATATYISSIAGTTLTFNTAFTSPVIGNTTVYPGVTGVNDTSIGAGAIFNISRSGGTYTVDSIVEPGQDYEVGDRLFISGASLGGQFLTHDLVLRVLTLVDTDSAIGTVAIEGTAYNGTAQFVGLTPDVNGGTGTGFSVDVIYEDTAFTSVSLNIAGSGYVVNDVVKVSGSAFSPLGVNDTNDLKITITGVDGTGAVTTFTFAGTAPDAQRAFPNPTVAYSGGGSSAQFTVDRSAAVYSVSVTQAGTAYQAAETFTILGTDLGGLTPAHDATITIDNVDGSGAITAASISGTARNYRDSTIGGTGGPTLTQQVIGAGLTLTVDSSGGTYSLTITDGGADYGPNQTLTILGSELIGQSPANDLSITIDTIGVATGVVTAVSGTGTAAGGTASYTNIISNLESPAGTGASFGITRSNSAYTPTIGVGGSDYKVGNRIVIPGNSLGGTSPLNDITITVATVSGGGTIATFTNYYEDAVKGIEFDLICTLTSTEQTTGLISTGASIVYEALPTLEITFANAHGLVPGDTFIATVQSDDGSNNHALAGGSFFATNIPSVDKVRYQARAAGFITDDVSQIQGVIYPRPDSFFVHRPFDGGVQLGTGGPQHGAQAIRQSKKYIRYQSGKGIMYTTGALFAPSYDLRSLTSDGIEVGSLITVETDDNDHGVQEGGIIRILGVETPGYNSGAQTAVPPTFDYTVVSVLDERRFTVLANRRLGATDAILGFGSQMSVISWHGATVRSGIFDDQNGIFWEFDGTQINVAQRTGTRQLAGTIAMNIDDNLISGINTRFRDQLKAGDRIIIKGMTHVVSHVNSQTNMTVTPDWRGVVDIAGAKANLIVDKKVKQSEFNLDRLDGTGPSGYDIDIAKMQMIGIQYSWYGAGFIDFMLRGADGNFVFAHRMRNSNVNTEAFMRSGNLPVRYEVTNEGPPGKLAASMDTSQTTLTLTDSSFFPDAGTVYIDNEIINFNGNNKVANTLTGLTRSATFQNFQAGANRSYTAAAATSHDDRTGVVLISNTITPLISHWGSAFITDGGFDSDRGYIFSYAETGVEVSTTKQTAFMIRLAPSVSNAIVGDLGERELLNRAQLLLQGLEITSDGTTDADALIKGGIVVEGVLNPQNYPLNPADVGWSGLSGVAQGGQPSFAQVAGGGAIAWSTGEAATTTNVTTQAFPSGSISLQPYWWNGRYAETGRDYVLLRNEDYNAYINSGMNQGDTFAHPNFTTTTIRRFSGSFTRSGVAYRWMYLNRQPNSSTNTNNTGTVSKTWKTSTTSEVWFQQASFAASGATVGTDVSATNFPASTQISYISLEQYFTTSYYVARFNNTSDGTVLNPGTSAIEFSFVQPPYAQPGETVFSFIANPGERSTLSLAELKELTNTPLGGRGTYPNGPDVLAINVYKVAGAASSANIILRWGEAQA